MTNITKFTMFCGTPKRANFKITVYFPFVSFSYILQIVSLYVLLVFMYICLSTFFSILAPFSFQSLFCSVIRTGEPYIFVYDDVTVSEPVFFRVRFSARNYRRLSFLCNVHALLTNPLRCSDTNPILVDGRMYQYVWTQIFLYPHTKICEYKNLRIRVDEA